MSAITREHAHDLFVTLRRLVRGTPDAAGTRLQFTLPRGCADAPAMAVWLNRVVGEHDFAATADGHECSLDADFTLGLPPLADARERKRAAKRRAAAVLVRLKAFFALGFDAAVADTPPSATYVLETTARPTEGPSDEDRAIAADRARAILRAAHADAIAFRMEQLTAGGRATHALVLDTRDGLGGRPRVPSDQLKALAKALTDAVDHGLHDDRGFSVCFAPVAGSDTVSRADLTTVVPGVTELRGVWSTGTLEAMREQARRLLAVGFNVRMADVPATAVVTPPGT